MITLTILTLFSIVCFLILENLIKNNYLGKFKLQKYLIGNKSYWAIFWRLFIFNLIIISLLSLFGFQIIDNTSINENYSIMNYFSDSTAGGNSNVNVPNPAVKAASIAIGAT